MLGWGHEIEVGWVRVRKLDNKNEEAEGIRKGGTTQEEEFNAG